MLHKYLDNLLGKFFEISSIILFSRDEKAEAQNQEISEAKVFISYFMFLFYWINLCYNTYLKLICGKVDQSKTLKFSALR